MKLYEIVADYRQNNQNKPRYYVYGESKVQAKRRFTQHISWLKIYEVNELSPGRATEIASHPELHIIF